MIYGLVDYNLSENDLKKSDHKVIAEIDFAHLDVEANRHLSPKKRKKKNKAQLRETDKLMRAGYSDFKTRMYGSKPMGGTGTFTGKQIKGLTKDPRISSISIKEIPGLKRNPKEPDDPNIWFNVICHYVIQFQNQAKGYQTHETRHYLVRARSHKSAQKKVWKEARLYDAPYFNTDMELLRWKLFDIVESYETFASYDLRPVEEDIIEVYSDMRDKRFKKKYFWDGMSD